ncbi:MAG: hypothetical protein CMJ19_16155, partial [Phycisphaeraceae bacterium]|nr:hypothetical protein [Phycisphaeraceae bacterium]
MRSRSRKQMSIVDAAIAELRPRSQLVLANGIVTHSLRPRQACMPTAARDDRSQPDSQTRIEQSARKQGISVDHFEEDNVIGDGNCLYWVVAHLLRSVGDGLHRTYDTNFTDLRRQVAERLRDRVRSGHHAFAMYTRLLQEGVLLEGVRRQLDAWNGGSFSRNGQLPDFAAPDATPEVERLYSALVGNYNAAIILQVRQDTRTYGVWSSDTEVEVIAELFNVVIFLYTTDHLPGMRSDVPDDARHAYLRHIMYPSMQYMRAMLSTEAGRGRWNANAIPGTPTQQDKNQRAEITQNGGPVRWHVVLHGDHYYLARRVDDWKPPEPGDRPDPGPPFVLPAEPPDDDCHAPPPPSEVSPRGAPPNPPANQAPPSQPYGKPTNDEPITVTLTPEQFQKATEREHERLRSAEQSAAAAAAIARANAAAGAPRKRSVAERAAGKARASSSQAREAPPPKVPPPARPPASPTWSPEDDPDYLEAL